MSLPSNVISDFCEVVITEDAKPAGSTSYGYAKVVGGQTYVQLDGSDILTPTNTTVAVANGERVLVTIKNHEAVVTGNISNQAASSSSVTSIAGEVAEITADYVKASKLETDYLSAKQLETVYATIESLNASEVAAKKLYATQATVETLRGDVATFKQTTATKLDANEADIKTLRADTTTLQSLQASYAKATQLDAVNGKIATLESTKASIDDLKTTNANIETLASAKIDANTVEADYAKIDFSNTGEAAINKLFADSGLIKDLVIQNGTVSSGMLQAVTILGDMVEAGTIKADRLVFLGDDGVYYQLNHNGVDGTTATQTDANSLNGSYIQAKSIAADKIAVSDLSAFNATIGGFVVDDDAIRTTGMPSVDNLVQGLYFGSNGEIYVGTGSDAYIRLYKTTENDSEVWKFELVVGGISFSAMSDKVDRVDETAKYASQEVGKCVREEDYTTVVDALKGDISEKLSTEEFNAIMASFANASGNVMTWTTSSDGLTLGFSYENLVKMISQTYSIPEDRALNYIHLGTYTDSSGNKASCLYLCDLDQTTNESSGNSFATLLTTNGLEFYKGSERLTYFTNQTMYILNALIEKSFTVGASNETDLGFSFRARDVGGVQHMGLRYE